MIHFAYTVTGVAVAFSFYLAIAFVFKLIEQANDPKNRTYETPIRFTILVVYAIYVSQAYRFGHFLLAPYIK